MEAIGAQRRCALLHLCLGGREDRGLLEHHRGTQHNDLLQPALGVAVLVLSCLLLEGVNGGVEGGSDDALVFCEEVIGKGMEVADAAYHRSASDDVVASLGEFLQQLRILRVSLMQLVVGVGIILPLNLAIFGEVVNSDDPIPMLKELLDKIATDEPSGPGDHHSGLLLTASCIGPRFGTGGYLTGTRQ